MPRLESWLVLASSSCSTTTISVNKNKYICLSVKSFINYKGWKSDDKKLNNIKTKLKTHRLHYLSSDGKIILQVDIPSISMIANCISLLLIKY